MYFSSRLTQQHHQLTKEYEEAARGILRRSTKQRKVGGKKKIATGTHTWRKLSVEGKWKEKKNSNKSTYM